jgi:hypothetical protein
MPYAGRRSYIRCEHLLPAWRQAILVTTGRRWNYGWGSGTGQHSGVKQMLLLVEAEWKKSDEAPMRLPGLGRLTRQSSRLLAFRTGTCAMPTAHQVHFHSCTCGDDVSCQPYTALAAAIHDTVMYSKIDRDIRSQPTCLARAVDIYGQEG